ncbi:MAG TPA: cation transporter [Methanocella sp.]|jgi:copper chaperone CopZ
MDLNGKKSVVLMLENLSCPDCARKIGMALKHSKGVSEAEVLYTTSKVKIVYDPAQAKVEDFVKIVEDIGYGVKGIKE